MMGGVAGLFVFEGGSHVAVRVDSSVVVGGAFERVRVRRSIPEFLSRRRSNV